MEIGNKKLDGNYKVGRKKCSEGFQVGTSQKTSDLQWVGEAYYIEKLQPTIRTRVQGQSTIFLTDEQSP
jgi:hypothetical protein